MTEIILEPDFKEEDDDNIEEHSDSMVKIEKYVFEIKFFFLNFKNIMKKLFFILISVCYLIYFVFALRHTSSDEGAITLMFITFIVVFCLINHFLKRFYRKNKITIPEKLFNFFTYYRNCFNSFLLVFLYLLIGIILLYDILFSTRDPYNLVSLSGLLFYVFLSFIFSTKPSKVKWKTILWGFGMQFGLALIILKWSAGFLFFKKIGDKLMHFFDFVEAGVRFVFGENFKEHKFAMKAIPTMIFVSSSISVLFCLGIMQKVILVWAGVMGFLMETTSGESVTTAANVFIGMSEAPLIIRPLLQQMTDSEIFAVMTGGFATIAGGMMAAFIEFGVPANHLLSASVMSAPAALAISKLIFPETKKTKSSISETKKHLKNYKENNVIDAAATGASTAVPLVALVIVNLIVFISLLNFVNFCLIWFGERIGMDQPLTFELVSSFLMWPLALVMGVELPDCRKVAKLIGVKIFVNEFVAYEKMKYFLENKKLLEDHLISNGNWSWDKRRENIYLYDKFNNTSLLINGIINDRSYVIATYALCGFSNFGSIGITLGVFISLLPHKKKVLSRLCLRAMLAGNVACFVTACVAGIFYQGNNV